VVTMQRQPLGSAPLQEPPAPRSAWIPVDVHWSDDPALCWDGVCAQGDLPLD